MAIWRWPFVLPLEVALPRCSRPRYGALWEACSCPRSTEAGGGPLTAQPAPCCGRRLLRLSSSE
eukprot:13069135-Alexandrium_andersonii.AAC.1